MEKKLPINKYMLIGGGAIIGIIGVASLIGVEAVTVIGGLAIGGGIVVLVLCQSSKPSKNGKSSRADIAKTLFVGLLIPSSDRPMISAKMIKSEEFQGLVDNSAFFFAGTKTEVELLEKDLTFVQPDSTKKTMYTYFRIETDSHFSETPTTKFSIKNLVTSDQVEVVRSAPLDSLDGFKAFRH